MLGTLSTPAPATKENVAILARLGRTQEDAAECLRSTLTTVQMLWPVVKRPDVDRDGRGWYVANDDGARISRHFASQGAAEARANLVRKFGQPVRRCLHCATPFRSEGPHNRMCDRCRSLGGSLG